MRTFFATMVYELHRDTPVEARQLLRAQLVGRRWQDRFEGGALPSTAVWIRRSAKDSETTDDLHAVCARELSDAVAAVASTGRPIALLRAWIHVSGAGTYGPAPVAPPRAVPT